MRINVAGVLGRYVSYSICYDSIKQIKKSAS